MDQDPYFRVSSASLEALEWSSIQLHLVEMAQTPMGKALAQTLVPGQFTDEQCAQRAFSAKELLGLKQEKELHLPLADSPEVRPMLKRISRLGPISVSEFADLVQSLKVVQGLVHFISKFQTKLPQNAALLRDLNLLESWSAKHFPLLDNRGELVDWASDDLSALRHLEKELHEKIKRRLEEFLHDPRLAEVMQDFYITHREGRYVLPIKANFRGRVSGIVHDVSNTEQTIFVEPEEVVEWNNQLKLVEREIEKEIERILGIVVKDTQPVVSYMFKNQDLIALADLVQSFAKFAHAWNGPVCVAKLGDQFSFESLYHPLLCLKRPVVKNSLSWEKALILTGPNTGGKTVLLKSAGLGLCLAKIGSLVPANGFEVSHVTSGLFVDIGDEQSLEMNLSTFSAHLSKLKLMLEDSHSDDLIMIDEIATGTSPEEGQPLAQAVIEHLLSRQTRIFITTHYGALKQFAMTNEHCRIAAMSFDKKTNRPTYQILMDIPGDSSALETAESVGLPEAVIRRSRELRSGAQNENVELSLRKLELAHLKIQEREQELQGKINQYEQEEQKARKRAQEYEQKQRAGLSDELKDVVRRFQALRDELSENVKKFESQHAGSSAVELFSKISEAAASARSKIGDALAGEDLKTGQLLPDSSVRISEIVEVEGIGVGEILETPKAISDMKAQVLVQVGDLKTRVSRGLLRVPSGQSVRGYKMYKKSQVKFEEKRGQRKT